MHEDASEYWKRFDDHLQIRNIEVSDVATACHLLPGAILKLIAGNRKPWRSIKERIAEYLHTDIELLHYRGFATPEIGLPGELRGDASWPLAGFESLFSESYDEASRSDDTDLSITSGVRSPASGHWTCLAFECPMRSMKSLARGGLCPACNQHQLIWVS